MLNVIREDAKSIITPEEAKELIARYEASDFKNRTPYCRTIDMYSSEISSGKWVLNGETIKLVNGVPIDGLNRLTSIIKADAPMECFVIELNGDINNIVSTIDIGRKRSIENALSMQGEMYERGAVSIVRYHKVLEKGGTCVGQSDINNGFTRQWLIEQYKNQKYEYNDAARFARGVCAKTPMKVADVGGIYMHLVYDLGWDTYIVEDFFNRIRSVAPAMDKGIFPTTYKELNNRDVRSGERTEIYMKAWNNWLHGNTVQRTVISDHFHSPQESKKIV